MTFTSSPDRRKLVMLGAACVILAAALAWLGFGPAGSKKPSVTPVAAPESPPRAVTDDPILIFQRAFWRSPAENDQILHAERRDWTGVDGLGKWQWFLVVQPSPELVKYLRDDNAFGLARASTEPEIEAAPEWFAFKPTDVEILQAPTSNLRLIFSKAGNLLFATDSGDGFRPGAPEAPAAQVKSPTSTGRLPSTPPPDPSSR